MTRVTAFVVMILYSLPEALRGLNNSTSFSDLLKSNKGMNLHKAWYALHEEGLLGEFDDEFWFHPLYERSNLEVFINIAVAKYAMIRCDGSQLTHHLDMLSVSDMEKAIEALRLPKELIEKASKRLNELLAPKEVMAR